MLDKVQMGRITKDLMESAKSMKVVIANVLCK